MLSSTTINDYTDQQSRHDATPFYPSCGRANVSVVPAIVDPRCDLIQLRNVYISGLPAHFTSADFRALCKSFGLIEASKLCESGRRKSRQGYGFALFYTDEAAAACIRGLNNALLCGRSLQARYADPGATPRAVAPVPLPSQPSSAAQGPSRALWYVLCPLYDVGLVGKGDLGLGLGLWEGGVAPWGGVTQWATGTGLEPA